MNNHNNMYQFCDKKAIFLEDINLQHFSFNHRHKFIDLTLDNIESLSEPHLVTLEANGIPFTLFLITIKGKKFCIMYDEKLKKYISVKFRFSPELYKGTVFKGDLRKNEHGQWFYYIHDMTYHLGEICMKQFSTRIKTIYDILKNHYKWDEYMNICQIKIRSYFLYEHLEKVKDEIVYFYPEKGNKVYKWIPNGKQSVKKNKKDDIIIAELHKTDKPDVYQIYHQGELLGNALIRTLKLSKELFYLFRKHKCEKYNVECKFNEKFQKWEPIRWSEHSEDHLQEVPVMSVEEVVEPEFEVPPELV